MITIPQGTGHRRRFYLLNRDDVKIDLTRIDVRLEYHNRVQTFTFKLGSTLIGIGPTTDGLVEVVFGPGDVTAASDYYRGRFVVTLLSTGREYPAPAPSLLVVPPVVSGHAL